MMLALRRASAPSVVHLRHINELTWQNQAALLTTNLPMVLGYLDDGAIVSLSPTRMAVPCARHPIGRLVLTDRMAPTPKQPYVSPGLCVSP
jgi:hypothetical protein